MTKVYSKFTVKLPKDKKKLSIKDTLLEKFGSLFSIPKNGFDKILSSLEILIVKPPKKRKISFGAIAKVIPKLKKKSKSETRLSLADLTESKKDTKNEKRGQKNPKKSDKEKKHSEKKPIIISGTIKNFSEVLPGIAAVLIVIILSSIFWLSQDTNVILNVKRDGKDNVSQEKSVQNFDKIEISGGGTFYLEQGEENSFTIEASKEITELINSTVRGSTLLISYKNPLPENFQNSDVKFYVSTANLQKVSIEGNAYVESSTVSTDKIDLEINGSGVINMHLEAERLSAILVGSGNFELKGKASQQDIQVLGTGSFDGKGLEGNEGKVIVASSGVAEVNIIDTLNASVRNKGSLYYIGEPELGEVDITGSGKMRKL